jgi:hypothetical protein
MAVKFAVLIFEQVVEQVDRGTMRSATITKVMRELAQRSMRDWV